MVKVLTIHIRTSLITHVQIFYLMSDHVKVLKEVVDSIARHCINWSWSGKLSY